MASLARRHKPTGPARRPTKDNGRPARMFVSVLPGARNLPPPPACKGCKELAAGPGCQKRSPFTAKSAAACLCLRCRCGHGQERAYATYVEFSANAPNLSRYAAARGLRTSRESFTYVPLKKLPVTYMPRKSSQALVCHALEVQCARMGKICPR
jgi:hypothetical protein